MKSLTVGCTAVLCVLGIQFVGFGAVYYSGTGTGNRTIAGGCVKWYSDRACKVAATVTPAKGDGNVYVFLASAKMNPCTFSAKAYFGCDGSLEGEAEGGFYPYANKGTFTFEDCTLISGNFAAQGGPEAVAFAGNYYIPDNKKFTFQAFGSDRNFTFATNSVFTSGTNTTITFLMTKVGGNCTTKFTVNGDFSGYKERFNAPAADRPQGANVRGILSLVSASSFGDPSEPKANAVTIGNSNYLHVASTAVQTSSRGITMDLSKGKRAGVYADANDRWTLTAPVKGSAGTFAKIGAGTTVLDGPFDFPTVDVEAGTLVLGKNGTFRNNMTVHVASGARLALNQTPAGLSVSCDEGGSIVCEVPYDPATGTTPLQVTSERFADLKTRFPDGIPLTLTRQVSLPLNERLRACR